MTIQVDIAKQDALTEVVAHVRAGEDVELTSDGLTLAVVIKPPIPPEPPKARRQLGLWAHLNLNIPAEVFTDPDPELEALMDDPLFPKG
jgi:antitoxin (DNA-binding transcriptional repressor) of toxin-antitoxin stability system